jgi:hypothetical protein
VAEALNSVIYIAATSPEKGGGLLVATLYNS